MNKILMLNCLLVIKLVKTSGNFQEFFLMNQLLPYFDDQHEMNFAINEKNTGELAVIEPEFPDKIDNLSTSMRDRRLADHYWTRKRGEETTTTRSWYNPNYPYQYVVPTQFGFPNSFYYLRGKRAADDENEQVKQVREVADEKLVDDKQASEVVAGDSIDSMKKRGNPDKDRRRGGPPFGLGGSFKRSMLQCCSRETNSPEILNQTIGAIKFQCQKDIRKSMNNTWDDIHDEDSVLKVTACDKAVQMKVVMFCTMDCVARKLGVIDDHGLIKVDAAKKFVMENFAFEMWEKQASDGIVDNCLTKVNESKRNNVDSMGVKCSIRAAELAYCVWRQMFLICPQDKQMKNPQCDRLRQSMKSS